MDASRDGFAAARRALWPSRRADPLDYRALLPERYDVDVKECYEMDAQIGEGGYSKVVVAHDRHCEGRKVAIKKVTKKSPRHVEAFHREAQVMRELDHPNICKLFELFEDSKHLFFVMELCAGGELLDRILKDMCISEKVSAQVLEQVVCALRYAHARKVAHRDLKPENIVFCSSDVADTTVKVIDWGLSALFEDDMMRSAVGTFMYSAPEVIGQSRVPRDERVPYTSECDIWSLGVVAYVMLCGKPPFWGERRGMLEKIKAADYPMDFAPWQGPDALSAAAADFVRSLMRPVPAERPTAEALSGHPWLRQEIAPVDRQISAEVMRNLQEFSRLSLFRHVCVAIIAQQLDHEHLHDLERVFKELDASGDGVLSLEEVRAGFSKILGKSAPEGGAVDELFRAVDLDGSGTIDYTEFCAAGLGHRAALQEESLWAAFRSLDRSGVSGRLTSDDLTSVLAEVDVKRRFSVQTCGEVAREVLRRWDTDSDGGIDFDEFRALMMGHTEGPVKAPESGPVSPPRPGSRSRTRTRSPRRGEPPQAP